MTIKDFPLRTRGKETPERILKAVINEWDGLQDVVVIGNVNGEVWVSGTYEQEIEVLGLMELGKFKLMMDDEEEE